MQKTYQQLYNEHPEYIAIRTQSGRVWEKYVDDVLHYKITHMQTLLTGIPYQTILEVGCATGFLLHNFPSSKSGQRYGIDISEENIKAARQTYTDSLFFAGTLAEFQRAYPRCRVDLVLLSDILEHVEDDRGLLRGAGIIGKMVLVNLPLEKVEENRTRSYGRHDREGHLRAYDKADALRLFASAGFKVTRLVEVQYVREPIFRKYLFNKLVKNADGDKLKGLIQYTEELIHIDNNPGHYKSNLFALLTRKTVARDGKRKRDPKTLLS